MAIANWQSNEIKRFNENLARVIKEFTINNETATNPYLSKYIRAILKSGLDYTVKIDSTGKQIYTIRNTAKNREDIDKLIDARNEIQPQSVGEIREETRRKIEEQRAATGDTTKVTMEDIKRQTKLDIYYINIDENLNLLYNFYGVDVMSGNAKNLPPKLKKIYKTLKKRKGNYKTELNYQRAKDKAVEDLYYALEDKRKTERARARKNASNWG